MVNSRMNKDKRKEQIIEVATKLFSKKGFNGVKKNFLNQIWKH